MPFGSWTSTVSNILYCIILVYKISSLNKGNFKKNHGGQKTLSVHEACYSMVQIMTL